MRLNISVQCKKNNLMQPYLYPALAFVVGFVVAWFVRSLAMVKLKKALKSTKGYLESETLKKETIQKENMMVHQIKQATETELLKKLEKANELNKGMDMDILLLQKSNEETEALLQAKEPAVHALKLQLLESQNIIARYKALQQKEPQVARQIK